MTKQCRTSFKWVVVESLVAQPLYIGFSNGLFSGCSHLIPGEGLLHYGGLTGYYDWLLIAYSCL